MLHAVAQLAEDVLGDVGGALGDEVDADALGADEADDLLNLVEQGLRGVGEEHVGLIEEEDELGQGQVAHLGQRGVELREEPEQKRRVELGLHHQLVGSQHVHDALAALGLHQVVDVERGLAEELVGALGLQLQQGALDGADGGRRDVAIGRRVLLGMLRNVVEHRPQVLQVEDHQAALVGHAEDDVQHAVLRLVQSQQAREQLGPHLRDGGTHGMALLAVDVEEAHGTRLEFRHVRSEK